MVLEGWPEVQQVGEDGEAQLLQLFDGGGNSSTRVGRNGGDYSASQVSVIGGIQPEILTKAIKGNDYSGKWARFVLAAPSRCDPSARLKPFARGIKATR